MREKFTKCQFLLKPTLIMFVIYLVGVSAILLADVHYADDIARTNLGYAGWSSFSRYSSTILSHGIHADNYLTNIAPLPQILAVGILALTSVMLVGLVAGKDIFKEHWTKWILRLVAVTPLGLCPYMLECLSYQYDAVYMALSVFFAVMPFIFYRQEKWKFILASVVGILGVCTTYQASIGIYPMIMIFIVMKDWSAGAQKNKEIIKNILIAAAVFLITLLVFQKVLMRAQDMYVSNEIPGLSEFFPALFSHFGHYLELLAKDFRILWLVLIILIIIGFIVSYAIESKRNKILAVLAALFGVTIMGVMAYLFYAALDKPLYTTRAMYAIGALIAIMSVYIVSTKISKKILMVLFAPPVVLSWCFFSFAFTYGNALKEQDTFRNMQIDMVMTDLNGIVVDGKPRNIQAVGQIDFAPAIKHMPEKEYYILRRLLKPSFETYVPWMVYRLTEASGLPNIKFNPNINLKDKEMPVIKDTALYIIYGDAENILVKFKGQEFNIWEN